MVEQAGNFDQELHDIVGAVERVTYRHRNGPTPGTAPLTVTIPRFLPHRALVGVAPVLTVHHMDRLPGRPVEADASPGRTVDAIAVIDRGVHEYRRIPTASTITCAGPTSPSWPWTHIADALADHTVEPVAYAGSACSSTTAAIPCRHLLT